jgi:hypothetical protein
VGIDPATDMGGDSGDRTWDLTKCRTDSRTRCYLRVAFCRPKALDEGCRLLPPKGFR